MAGAALFVSVFTIEGYLRPGYDPRGAPEHLERVERAYKAGDIDSVLCLAVYVRHEPLQAKLDTRLKLVVLIGVEPANKAITSARNIQILPAWR